MNSPHFHLRPFSRLECSWSHSLQPTQEQYMLQRFSHSPLWFTTISVKTWCKFSFLKQQKQNLSWPNNQCPATLSFFCYSFTAKLQPLVVSNSSPPILSWHHFRQGFHPQHHNATVPAMTGTLLEPMANSSSCLTWQQHRTQLTTLCSMNYFLCLAPTSLAASQSL